MTARLCAAGLAAVVLLVSPVRAAENDDGERAETYEMLNLFGDVFERVRADYVDEVSDQALIESAVNGMLSSLDPHSGYLDTSKFDEMKVQTHGSFGGLGIEVTMENGLVKVVSPIDETPAAEAGIEPGDLITHIDDEQVLGMTLAEAVKKMRGNVGTTIKLTIRREEQPPMDVTLTRDVIKISSVRSRLEGKVGYIRISSFNEQTESGLTEQIAKLKEESGGQLQGYVLDLRNNPGGLLSQAVAVSDAFLEQGEIVSTRARNPDDAQRFNAHAGDLGDGLPLVVLVNAGSASASEIVAGALQDHGRAILLGTKSFGKGSVQTIVPLTGHGAMRLTTARYYTPSGRSIQAVGIEPDLKVEQARVEALDRPDNRREADLRGALDRPESDTKTGTDIDVDVDVEVDGEPLPEVKKENEVDYQLERALDLVRGLSLFASRKAETGATP
jgi:carboxyl-terminal processing protease